MSLVRDTKHPNPINNDFDGSFFDLEIVPLVHTEHNPRANILDSLIEMSSRNPKQSHFFDFLDGHSLQALACMEPLDGKRLAKNSKPLFPPDHRRNCITLSQERYNYLARSILEYFLKFRWVGFSHRHPNSLQYTPFSLDNMRRIWMQKILFEKQEGNSTVVIRHRMTQGEHINKIIEYSVNVQHNIVIIPSRHIDYAHYLVLGPDYSRYVRGRY
jgi:hypothetical protein